MTCGAVCTVTVMVLLITCGGAAPVITHLKELLLSEAGIEVSERLAEVLPANGSVSVTLIQLLPISCCHWYVVALAAISETVVEDPSQITSEEGCITMDGGANAHPLIVHVKGNWKATGTGGREVLSVFQFPEAVMAFDKVSVSPVTTEQLYVALTAFGKRAVDVPAKETGSVDFSEVYSQLSSRVSQSLLILIPAMKAGEFVFP